MEPRPVVVRTGAGLPIRRRVRKGFGYSIAATGSTSDRNSLQRALAVVYAFALAEARCVSGMKYFCGIRTRPAPAGFALMTNGYPPSS